MTQSFSHSHPELAYLEAEVEFLQRALHLIGQRVHALAFLHGDDGVGRTLVGRHLRLQLMHVELVGQLLQYVVQRRLDLCG